MRRSFFLTALLSVVLVQVIAWAGFGLESLSFDLIHVRKTETKIDAKTAPTISLKFEGVLAAKYDNWERECELTLGQGIDIVFLLPMASEGRPASEAAFVRGIDQTKRVEKYGTFDAKRQELTLHWEEYLPLLDESGTLIGQLAAIVPGGMRVETEFRLAAFFPITNVKHGPLCVSTAWPIRVDRALDTSLAPAAARKELRRVTADDVRKRCMFLRLVHDSGVAPADIRGTATDQLLLTVHAAPFGNKAATVICSFEGEGMTGPVLRGLVMFFDQKTLAGNDRPNFRTMPGSGNVWRPFLPGCRPIMPTPELTAAVDRPDPPVPLMMVDTGFDRNRATFIVPNEVIDALSSQARFGVITTSEGVIGADGKPLFWKVAAPNSAKVSLKPGAVYNLTVVPAQKETRIDGTGLSGLATEDLSADPSGPASDPPVDPPAERPARNGDKAVPR